MDFFPINWFCPCRIAVDCYCYWPGVDVGGAVDGGQDAVADDEDDARSAKTQHFLKWPFLKVRQFYRKYASYFNNLIYILLNFIRYFETPSRAGMMWSWFIMGPHISHNKTTTFLMMLNVGCTWETNFSPHSRVANPCHNLSALSWNLNWIFY